MLESSVGVMIGMFHLSLPFFPGAVLLFSVGFTCIRQRWKRGAGKIGKTRRMNTEHDGFQKLFRLSVLPSISQTRRLSHAKTVMNQIEDR